MEDGRIVEYFEDAITTDDEKTLNAKTGSSQGQQIWEALAVLYALRLWAYRWRYKRIRLRAKADDLSALVMVARTKAKGAGTSPVAR